MFYLINQEFKESHPVAVGTSIHPVSWCAQVDELSIRGKLLPGGCQVFFLK